MKSFRMKKLWKAISLSLCGILTAGIIAGCSSENTVDKTTLKFGVTNFADTLEPTQNYFGWVVMRYAIGECLAKFDEKMNVKL